jgi:hypothetical protein
MQEACMCSQAKLRKRYSATMMRDCNESFLPSILRTLGTFRLSLLAGFCSGVTHP